MLYLSLMPSEIRFVLDALESHWMLRDLNDDDFSDEESATYDIIKQYLERLLAANSKITPKETP